MIGNGLASSQRKPTPIPIRLNNNFDYVQYRIETFKVWKEKLLGFTNSKNKLQELKT